MCLKAISLFIMHKLFFPSRVSRRSCSYDSVPLPWLFSLFVAKWTFMLTLKTTLRVKSSSLSMCCSRGNKIIFRPPVCGIFGKETDVTQILYPSQTLCALGKTELFSTKWLLALWKCTEQPPEFLLLWYKHAQVILICFSTLI